jgi:hypothetical protein
MRRVENASDSHQVPVMEIYSNDNYAHRQLMFVQVALIYDLR